MSERTAGRPRTLGSTRTFWCSRSTVHNGPRQRGALVLGVTVGASEPRVSSRPSYLEPDLHQPDGDPSSTTLGATSGSGMPATARMLDPRVAPGHGRSTRRIDPIANPTGVNARPIRAFWVIRGPIDSARGRGWMTRPATARRRRGRSRCPSGSGNGCRCRRCRSRWRRRG